MVSLRSGQPAFGFPSLHAAESGRKRVPVLLPRPFPGPFDYAVPDGQDPQPGDIVLVPLNRREEVGVVWDGEPDAEVPASKLKPITAVLDALPLPAALRRFVDWVAAYTLAFPGDVLAMALRVNALEAETPPPGWRYLDGRRPHDAGAGAGGRRAGRRRGRGARRSWRGRRGWRRAWCAAWRRPGCWSPVAMPVRPPFATPDPAPRRAQLCRPSRPRVPRRCATATAARAFSVTLLDGVTGSGKTEVYLEAVAECVAQGRQALVLLPEIALSSQWLERFEARFGVPPAVWHSDLASRTRRVTWRAVAEGGAPVVVGARSALFLPFPDLGLIVVDEEHETAFKQEDGVAYHARDMAVVRARLSEAPAVLVSATPSLETLANVEAGRYGRITLASRHGGAKLPDVEAIDLRDAPPERGRFLSPVLVARGAGDVRARASRRCCSSTAAATRRSRCAGTAGIGCSARTARHGWSSTGRGGRFPATIAATPSRSRPPARAAARSTAWCRSGPAWSGSPRRRRRCSRRRGGW